MIADEFVEIERRRKELFDGTKICSLEVLEPDGKVTQRQVLLCHCRQVELTECRCWG